MLKQKEIHYDWKNILRFMSSQTVQIVELPTDKKTSTCENRPNLSAKYNKSTSPPDATKLKHQLNNK